MILGLWTAEWQTGVAAGAPETLLAQAPRLAVGPDVIWVDARGLDAVRLAARIRAECPDLRVGVARGAVVAAIAARSATADQPIVIVPEDERAWLADQPLTVLPIAERLRLLLSGVGIETCGALAGLEREAVEVRFGAELLELWQFARAEDWRRLFARVPPEPAHATIDFVDYVISDPERLLFSVNALFGSICDELRDSARHARRVQLTLSLANGKTWERVLRPARPTASRTVWLRLARAVLERITIDDAVTGVALVVAGTEAAAAVQGDLFDLGFATATAVDAAIARLIEAQGEIVVEPETSAHPLIEVRSSFVAEAPSAWLVRRGKANNENENGRRKNGSALALQLLEQPREILVETIRRRDHVVPIRYRDGPWKQLVTAAGPDRISGGQWQKSYAREYFRAVTVDGLLVWLYREARSDRWFLHGWWD